MLIFSLLRFCSLLLRFTDDTFDPEQSATIGLYNTQILVLYFNLYAMIWGFYWKSDLVFNAKNKKK